MNDRTVYLNLDGLTREEIGEVAAAAAAVGADLEEMPVAQGAEEFLQAAPIVMAVVSPLLKKGAEALLGSLTKRKDQRVYLPDLDVHLVWNDVAKEHLAEATQAIRLLEAGVFAPKSILVFDPSTKQWQPEP